MAPRRRQAAPSAPASFASLPDALLERILGQLEQPDRHRAALVSQRWQAAAHAPQALQSITCLYPSRAQLQSLAAWLLRHGQHVQCFSLETDPASGAAVSYARALKDCLVALTAAESLQQLQLQHEGQGTGLHIKSWCVALRQLKCLVLSTNNAGPLRISSSLAGLAAVTRLTLAGSPVIVDATAQLPPNVERLMLDDSESTQLPQQLSCLTRLSMLIPFIELCVPNGYAVLTSLGRLEQLLLQDNGHLPACLPHLTTLKELRLYRASTDMEPPEIKAALEAALPNLTQLTSLCIVDWPPDRVEPLAALAGLSHLQRCCLGNAEYGWRQLEPPPPLPPGPWAASLRSLGARMDVLQHSTAMLSAATQLSRLVATGGDLECFHMEQFWGWARCHPSLQQLQIDMNACADVSIDTLHAICSLARQRPQLEVITVLDAMSGEPPTFEEEFIFDL